MLRNYFKIALRNILRNRISSVINILGLAVGISACVLIYMYVQNELSYDRHHVKADRIYRVTTDLNTNGQDDRLALSSYTLAPLLKQNYPEVEAATRLFPVSKQTVWHGEKVSTLENVAFADSNFFQVFDYDFLSGDPVTALIKPRSMVVTEETAMKYFGTRDALGKVLKFAKNPFTVTGVLKNTGDRSHINTNAFLSIATMDTGFVSHLSGDWFLMSTYSYLVFRSPGDVENFPERLKHFYNAHVVPWIKELKVNSSLRYRLQPLTAIHRTTDLGYDISANVNAAYVYIFSIVGFFILLIASINYMNMATARAASRSREVGMRKVMGAGRWQLFWQFIGESVLITLFALFLALVLTELLLPAFNVLTEDTYSLTFSGNPGFFLVLAGILLFVGFAGGSYPALVLSSFRPIEVLKGR
ncbi:MAG: ABC transporter permease [Bacteroidota bacterium]|nr:ABC transporter permease [Bacteroidota bacterium]